jgi:hypothetical protein
LRAFIAGAVVEGAMRGGVVALMVVATVAGCAAPEDEDALIGPDAGFGSAVRIAEDQWNEVNGIAVAEGATRFADLPASGSGTYRGAIAGWAEGGIPIDYVADLTVDVDFRDLGVSGEITNMVTDGIAGFTHPNGRIGLYGDIVRDADDDARIVLDGSGTLRGPGMEAEVRVDGAGSLVGADGRALRGRHATDFAWTQGYLEETVSQSDGVFSGVAE